MLSTARVPLGQRPAHPPISVTAWNGLLCTAASLAILVCAIGIRSEVYDVLSHAAYPILAILLLSKLLLPPQYASFDRDANVFWLAGFCSLCLAFKAIMRNGESGSGVFTLTAVCAALIGVPALLIAHHRAQVRVGLTPQPDRMLTGASLLLTALLAESLSTFCPSGPCAEWGDLNLFPGSWLVMFCLALVNLVRELRGSDGKSDAVPAVLALLALITAMAQGSLRFAALLWFAGTAIVVYEMYRRIQSGSIIAKFIEPERAWSRFGAIVLIGFTLCYIGARMNWAPPDADGAGLAPAGLMLLLRIGSWGFMLIPFLLMVKTPRARFLANIGALLLSIAGGAFWVWSAQAARVPEYEKIPLFYGGRSVYALGILLVIAGLSAITFRDRTWN